jgi:hypothetical protein
VRTTLLVMETFCQKPANIDAVGDAVARHDDVGRRMIDAVAGKMIDRVARNHVVLSVGPDLIAAGVNSVKHVPDLVAVHGDAIVLGGVTPSLGAIEGSIAVTLAVSAFHGKAPDVDSAVLLAKTMLLLEARFTRMPPGDFDRGPFRFTVSPEKARRLEELTLRVERTGA